MTNDFRMSYFMPPIAPIKNEQGRIVTQIGRASCRERV